MRDHQTWIQLAVADEGCEFFHAQAPTQHEAALDALVAHAYAPFDAGDADRIARAQVIHVAQNSTGLEHFDGFGESVGIAAGNNDPVNALALGHSQDLLIDRTVLVADDVGRAVGAGQVSADLAVAHGDDAARAPQVGCGNGHQAHRTDADGQYGIAKPDIGQLGAHYAGGHHIAHHAGLLQAHAVGNQRQVAVGVIYMAVIGKNAVLEV